MRTAFSILGIALFLISGCSSAPPASDSSIWAGMSRNDVLLRCGEPLRVEAGAGGGENWYYRFSWWETHPTGVAETHEEFGDKTSSVSVGLNFSRSNEEQAVHLSPDGYVVGPLPRGKVIKNVPRE